MLTVTNLFEGLSSNGKAFIAPVEQTLFNPSDFKKSKNESKEPIYLLFIRAARF